MTEEVAGVLAQISGFVGVPEAGFRLLLGILSGYPLALIYRKYLYNKPAEVQSLYFAVTGVCVGYWNFGADIFHCALSILISYCTITFLNGSALSVVIIFVFNFVYLMMGYYYASTEQYDINWTMPYCILCLRLIGVAFDVYDGQQQAENLSSDGKYHALKTVPSLVELFGHCMFPTAFLVGPQFPMRRYLDFVGGKYCPKDANGKLSPTDSVSASLRKFIYGVAYLAIFQSLSFFVSDDYILSEEYANLGFIKKMILLGVWGRFTLYKYISCWLLTEGACILFGVAYNGEKNGVTHWDGVENVKLSVFENTTEFNHYIMSFNTNTNQWIARYIYKRLKFFGNKNVSQFAALLFLAAWHGVHSGYYLTFLFELVVMYMEREVKSIVKSNERLSRFFRDPNVKLVRNLVLRLYTFVFMGWSLLPFALLTWQRYWIAFANCNYAGFLLFWLWPIVYAPLLRFVFAKDPPLADGK
ncbi:lysophospholipid acyltransferase 5 [Cylas formicarius]|uniref:lysophospholipid acyltransferase 5 n=1 Tax=Cylas formicarius TaxID=197179 RepID=UPI002958437E|nr:lysophospholipid acyltransferase 5 [Cylas formicarius]